MLTFDTLATRTPLAFERLIPALRQAFVDGAIVPPRHVHAIGADGEKKGTVLIMPAWNGRYLGIKTINIFPGNAARGLPGLHATYALYDALTGVPLAQMDGNEITARRTAAASALAASFLARDDARHLLVLGTGRVAQLLPSAFASARRIDRVSVWNHRLEGAEKLAAQWRAQGIDAQAVTGELSNAVSAADIVSCATLATQPLVLGAWLKPGAHLDLIGSFTPLMKEADAVAFSKSRVFVDTEEALTKAGDVLDALASGAWAADAVQATLAQLCRGERQGRQTAGENTLFKAVGTALEDLAAATLVWASR